MGLLRALSATQRRASMAPRTARPAAFSAGASLAACPAPSPRRRPLPRARASLPEQLTLVRPRPFEKAIAFFHFALTFCGHGFQPFYFGVARAFECLEEGIAQTADIFFLLAFVLHRL